MRHSGLLLVVAILTASGVISYVAAGVSPCQLCLYGPDNMTFDAAGNIYLVDTDQKTRSRVMKLSPQGKELAEWHVFAVVPGRQNGPAGITIDRDGSILVTDAGSGRVLRLTPEGKLLAPLPETFHHLDQGHVAVDGDGRIYVAEAEADLIQKFSSTGKRLASWHHGKGHGPDQWDHPEAISVAPDGNLVVNEWGNHRVDILSPSGQMVRQFDATKNVPLKFASISGSCVDHEGNIYVADYQLYRVQEFGSHGRLLATIGNTPGNILFERAPYSLACGNDGNLYSADGLSIVKYSRDGELLARWR
ncbi:MAG: NHL repeat-containing protein [Gammaproteobacteria bacterium]